MFYRWIVAHIDRGNDIYPVGGGPRHIDLVGVGVMDEGEWANEIMAAENQSLINAAKSAAGFSPLRAGAGICTGCDDPISDEITALFPNALRCDFCQDNFKRGS